MIRTLITGAAGFIGANLAARCLAEGCEVHALVRPGADRWRLAALGPAVHLLEVDLRDGPAVREAIARTRPDWVFHTAAHGAYSWQADARGILDTNVGGTVNLLEACAATGLAAFINAGTSSEYGRKDHAAAETEAAEPITRYAMSKLCATEYCRFFARTRQLPALTLRLYSVYGRFEDPRRLIPTLIAEGLAGRLPPLASRTASHDFVYIDDVCEAFVRMAAVAATAPGAVYNVGTGVQTTLGEVVDLARALLPIADEPAWNSMPAREWDTDVWVADVELIAGACGWRARTSVADGLQQFVAWLAGDPAMLDRYRRVREAARARRPSGAA